MFFDIDFFNQEVDTCKFWQSKKKFTRKITEPIIVKFKGSI